MSDSFAVEHWTSGRIIYVSASDIHDVFDSLGGLLRFVPFKVYPVGVTDESDLTGHLPRDANLVLAKLIEQLEYVPFDAYEIKLVAEYEGYCAPVDARDPNADSHMWTLYGHIPDQGVMAIADLDSLEAALALYQRITGGVGELSVEGSDD